MALTVRVCADLSTGQPQAVCGGPTWGSHTSFSSETTVPSQCVSALIEWVKPGLEPDACRGGATSASVTEPRGRREQLRAPSHAEEPCWASCPRAPGTVVRSGCREGSHADLLLHRICAWLLSVSACPKLSSWKLRPQLLFLAFSWRPQETGARNHGAPRGQPQRCQEVPFQGPRLLSGLPGGPFCQAGDLGQHDT